MKTGDSRKSQRLIESEFDIPEKKRKLT